MRIFDEERGGWGSKVNFVDANNVYVGYDMHQDCCEDADWFIQPSIYEAQGYGVDQRPQPTNEDLEGYAFDRSFHDAVEEVESPDIPSYLDGPFDGGGMVVFKLTKVDAPNLYLHLFNVHNGYYGHGFEFGIKDGEIFEQGTL